MQMSELFGTIEGRVEEKMVDNGGMRMKEWKKMMKDVRKWWKMEENDEEIKENGKT